MDNSARRVTRSQARAAGGAATIVPATPVSVKKSVLASSRKKAGRRALADLTNDSPVAGLTPLAHSSPGGILTPSCSRVASSTETCQGTPGDEVLRAHALTMLQQGAGEQFKVVRPVPSLLSQFADSPSFLAAPTPANTPANVVWPSSGQEEPEVPVSFLVSPASAREGTVPVVASDSVLESSGPVMESTWSTVPLCSPKTSSEHDNAVQDECIQATEVHLPVVEAATKIVVDLDMSTADQNPRTLLFESPAKNCTLINKASLTETTPTIKDGSAEGEEDRWSVDVNVRSPPSPDEVDDMSYDALDGDSTDSETSMDFAKRIEACSSSPEVEKKVAGESELVSTPLAVNPSFVKFRLREEKDGPSEGSNEPNVWVHRKPATEGHFEEFDNEDECDEDEWADCEEEYDGEEEYDDFDEVDCDELCMGISHISMSEHGLKGLPKPSGTHKRFHYSSDGEMEEEIVKAASDEGAQVLSPSITRLKGLPTPLGEHLRFAEDDSD